MWSQWDCILQMRAGSARCKIQTLKWHCFKHFIAPKWLSNATYWIGSNDWVTCWQLTQSNNCLNDRWLTRSQSPPQSGLQDSISPETLTQLFDHCNMSAKASFKCSVWTFNWLECTYQKHKQMALVFSFIMRTNEQSIFVIAGGK